MQILFKNLRIIKIFSSIYIFNVQIFDNEKLFKINFNNYYG